MTHRIFYGTDFKLTDSDKKMFSREGYECKDLLQGRDRKSTRLNSSHGEQSRMPSSA